MLSAKDPGRTAYFHSAAVGLRLSNRTFPSSAPSSSSLSSPSKYYSQSDLPRYTAPQVPTQHIWIVTGPAGCGKTTVAQKLANELSLPYIEGDDYHSKSNKEKMASSIPLTDADRWDWLIQLREAAIERLASKTPPAGVVVTCSALKHKYRDVMRVAAYDHPSVQIHFIYLRASEDVLLQRVTQRKGHYMKSSMVHSQFEMLEEPDSEWDALSVDCAASPTEVHRRVMTVVRRKLAESQ